ncbi:MAG TPA: hypothetical protein VFU99_03645 [Gaiellaceae bacterium]|nr:hypothetical protein [Gaiellaceae bacterium]
MRRSLALLITAVVAALAVATAATHAAAPEREWVTLDDTFTWDDCGFVVEEHATGSLHFISWFDDSGARTRQLVAAPRAKVTWTNRATGASVSTANSYVAHKRDNPDGSVTIAFTGLVFALPGGGRAYVDAGRAVIVFMNGNVELLSSVGPSAELCEALEATIG